MNTPKRAIINPTLDLLAVGAISIVSITIYLLVIGPGSSPQSLGFILTLATLINGAHFMASYRLLYNSKEQILRYKSASIYIPIFLVLFGLWSLIRLNTHPDERMWVQTILIVTAFYLALHYTGQAWGMMASFSFIEGTYFDSLEKRVFLLCMKILVIWQIVWSLYLIHDLPPLLIELKEPLNLITDSLAILSLVAGLLTFARMGKRLGKIPSSRIITPFIALYFWYALIAKHPAALLGVQISHSIQYLIFPVRVELNRVQYNNASINGSPKNHFLAYIGVMLGSAALFFLLLPYLLRGGYEVYSQVLISLINIHHFYTDGCIWKITSPVVKDELFAHLKNT